MTIQRPLHGYRWRILAHHDNGRRIEVESGTEPICFDELVIDEWFHLEQLDRRTWHLVIGTDLHLSIQRRPDGTTSVRGWTDGDCHTIEHVSPAGAA